MTFYVEKRQLREPNLWVPGKKPVGAVKIDWGNPITEGLQRCYLFTNKDEIALRDLVTGLSAKHQGTGTAWGIYDGINATYFDGGSSSKYIETGFPPLDCSGGFTVMYMADALTGESVNSYFIGSHGTTTSADRLVVTHLFNGDTLYWDYGNALASGGRILYDFTGPGTYMDKWSSIALVSEGKGGSYKAISIDGEIVASDVTVSDGPDGTMNDMYIGASSTNVNNETIGRYSYLYLWSNVKSQEEIRSIHRDPYQFLIPA